MRLGILGQDVLGQIVAQVARRQGAAHVTVADASAHRLARAVADQTALLSTACPVPRPSPIGDIIALVEPTLKRENGDRDVRAMASFLHVLALERRRLKGSAAGAEAKLRDERRAAETQKQRAEALQQKLDALTELEKSLTDRNAQSR